MNDLGAIGTEKKEDTLKALRGTGWSLMTNTEGRILELDQERKKGLEGRKKEGWGWMESSVQRTFRSETVSTGCTC